MGPTTCARAAQRSTRLLALAFLAFAGAAAPVAAQTTGSILGVVVDARTGQPLAAAEVSVPPLPQRSVTGPDGRFVITAVPPGERRVAVQIQGYQSLTLDRVQVRAGQQSEVRFELDIAPVAVPGITVDAERARLIDPDVSASQQVVLGRELRELPITTLKEAVELTPGVSDGHFRGGRSGQEVYVVDGLELKNQLEASTQGFGLEFSPSSLEEVGVVTGGFGAEYGSALSGVVRYVTRRGNTESWRGNAGLLTDQWAPAAIMRGFTGISLSADGPVNRLGAGTTLFADLSLQGMLDADPRSRGLTCLKPEHAESNLAVPIRAFAEDPSTRHLYCPYTSPMLPHQQGDKMIAFGRLDRPLPSVPGEATLTVSLLRNRTEQQLYTQEFKYNPDYQLGQRTTGTLASASVDWSHHRQGRAYQVTGRTALMRLDRYLGAVDPWTFSDRLRVAGFGIMGFRFLGEDFVRRPIDQQLEEAAAVPGYLAPGGSTGSPYGAAAEGIFFTEGTPHIANWSRTDMLGGDVVAQMVTSGGHALRGGTSLKLYRVESYERLLAYLPGSAPNFARFFPAMVSGFGETKFGAFQRATLSFGARVEAFRTGIRFREDRNDFLAPELDSDWKFSFMPRLGVTLPVLNGQSAVRFNFGMVAQAPDFRYFVDGSIGDSLRTDLRRQGNPTLSFERGNTYEVGYRHMMNENVGVDATVFRKELGNLITGELTLASTAARQVTTGESGTVHGVELTVQGRWPGLELRGSYGLQKAVALMMPTVDSLMIGGRRPLEIPLSFDRRHSLDGAAFVGSASGDTSRWWGGSTTLRIRSGYPLDPQRLAMVDLDRQRMPRYLPWSVMLNARATAELPIRAPGCGGCKWRAVVDGRNLLGRDNVVGLRRETGMVAPAYRRVLDLIEAVPPPAEVIPKESPQYNRLADLDGDGYITASEFRLARVGAALDRFDPSLYMGEAMQLRIGVEVAF